MKYNVKYTRKFKKSYKKLEKSGKNIEQLDSIIKKLQNGETLEPKYMDHALIGNFAGFRECHVAYDWVLVYYYEDDVLVLTLYDTGTHSRVLGL